MKAKEDIKQLSVNMLAVLNGLCEYDIDIIGVSGMNERPMFAETITLDSAEVDYCNKLLKLKGSTIRRKYGLKRDERPCALEVTFSNGYYMDIDLIICEDDSPFINVVLFDADGMEAFAKVYDTRIDDVYELSDETGDYVAKIVAT